MARRPRLTDRQQEALEFDRDLAVTANAGTGKTMVLVHRFVRILLESPASLKHVVAITFTDKAASELRARIGAHLRERIASAATEAERRALSGIRDRLAGAPIGTIHSFCAQLLREFPVEANVDAGFTVLEGIDQRILAEESISGTFEDILVVQDSFREQFMRTVRMLGRASVHHCISTFLRKREQMNRLLEGPLRPDPSDAEILQGWGEALRRHIQPALDDPGFTQALKTIRISASGRKGGQAVTRIDAWLALSGFGIRLNEAASLLQLLLTKEGTLRKDVIGPDQPSPDLVAAEGVLRNIYDRVGSFAGTGGEPGPPDITLLHTLRVLLEVYRRALERYELAKSEAGQLDFDDLQFRTRDLLTTEGIGPRLREKFRFLMIDEFQDTNYLQYEIIRLLMSHFDRGNLFIVGDPKQSIYGFRNAEAEIFEAARREMTRSGSGDEIVLAESFRLLPSVADMTNRIFSGLMRTADSPFDFPYSPIISARDGSEDGRIEFLLLPHPGAGPGGDLPKQLREARMLAQRLAELWRTKTMVQPSPDAPPRPFHFGDAAILVRDRRYVRELEQAMREYNVPAILSGGTGYYQTQEVYDFLNYLTFLLNTDDDLALAGILRSPFFAISDSELFEISLKRGNGSFWSGVRQRAEDSSSSASLRRAAATLAGDLQLVNRIPIPMLIQRVFRATGWHGTVAGLRTGSQNTANMQKLLAIAREFEARGFLSLYDFVERISALTKEEEREGQAPIEQHDDAVHIMTIHAAKGLEFPVVCLPFLDEGFRYDTSPYLDPTIGIGIMVKKEDNFDEDVAPSTYHMLKQRNRLRSEAEEKRILYVAVTRARDILILSGAGDVRKSRTSALRWIFEQLAVSPTELPAGPLDLGKHPLRTLDRSDGRDQLDTKDHRLVLYVTRPEDLAHVRPLPEEDRQGVPTPPMLLSTLEGNRREEFFSATQLKTYLECPAKFYIKNVVGLPEPDQWHRRFSENGEANDALSGDAIGLLTHAVLQQLANGPPGSEELGKIIRDHLTSVLSIPLTDRERAVKTVRAHVADFCASPIGREVLESKEFFTEYTLTTLLAEDYLTGTIDRLYRKTTDGTWAILDYKTDRVNRNTLETRAASYRIQMAVYALLVNRHFNQEDVEATIVFLRLPEHPVRFTFGVQAVADVEHQIRDAISQIKSHHFPQNPNACENCGYFQNGRCLLTIG